MWTGDVLQRHKNSCWRLCIPWTKVNYLLDMNCKKRTKFPNLIVYHLADLSIIKTVYASCLQIVHGRGTCLRTICAMCVMCIIERYAFISLGEKAAVMLSLQQFIQQNCVNQKERVISMFSFHSSGKKTFSHILCLLKSFTKIVMENRWESAAAVFSSKLTAPMVNHVIFGRLCHFLESKIALSGSFWYIFIFME